MPRIRGTTSISTRPSRRSRFSSCKTRCISCKQRRSSRVRKRSLKLATTTLTHAWQSSSRCRTPIRAHSRGTSGARSTHASPTAPWPAWPSSASLTLSMQTRPYHGSKSARITTAGSAWSKGQNRMLRRVGPHTFSYRSASDSRDPQSGSALHHWPCSTGSMSLTGTPSAGG